MRIAVEWLFSAITTAFQYFKMADGLKPLQTHPVLLYRATFILFLARTLLLRNAGNQFSKYFGVKPPHISDVFF